MELFISSAGIMGQQSIPASLAEDWLIVTEYLTEASTAISRRLASEDSELDGRRWSTIPDIAGPTPMVIRFDLLARLTTTGGATRLRRAALAVQGQVEVPHPPRLDSRELHVLKRLTAGVPIVDLAGELGYSERSMYRVLANIWQSLGVPGRKEGLAKASSEGISGL